MSDAPPSKVIEHEPIQTNRPPVSHSEAGSDDRDPDVLGESDPHPPKYEDVEWDKATDGNRHSGSQTIVNRLLGDQPAGKAADDKLGFGPYVAAVAAFLTDTSTKTPLTLSIEGCWGSGKSSFMLQLQEELGKRGKTKIVSFNAWQYNADEGLWAAFIHEFDAKLNAQLNWHEKIRARARLLKLRLSWQDWIVTAKAAVWLVGSIFALGAIFLYLLHGGIDTFKALLKQSGEAGKSASKTIALVGGIGGSVAALLLFLSQVKELFKSPASIDRAAQLFARPNYSGTLPLIRRITEDFSSLVQAYAPNDDVFVFIDDLDRCEYSKAAELMQALLMLLSSAPKIALILGLDREKVAAAMATRQEKILPYLYRVQPAEIYSRGLDYGQAFIEKFIQVSYILPIPPSNSMKAMINPDATPAAEPVPASQKSEKAIEIVTGKDDSETLNVIIDMADQVFDHNPRNVKQFVNMFRLQAFIANETGLFGSGRVSRSGKPLTIGQLAKFVALCMRWPKFVEAASANPVLVKTLETHEPRSDRTFSGDRESDRKLMLLLDFARETSQEDYSLADVDFSKLTEIVPGRVRTAAAQSPPSGENRTKTEHLEEEAETKRPSRSPKGKSEWVPDGSEGPSDWARTARK